jgi:hypothetical protein
VHLELDKINRRRDEKKADVLLKLLDEDYSKWRSTTPQ